jgi:nucleotide-binding universal stress UspA family protein
MVIFMISGVPSVEIVKVTKEKDVHLIVMGTYGRSWVRYFLVGRVTVKVPRKSHVL